MRKLPLFGGLFALVDDEDYPRVSRWSWHVRKDNNSLYAYRSTRVKGACVSIPLHRLLMDAPKGVTVDHINHNGLDCQKQNLRICSNAENSRNGQKRRGLTSSKFKGVVWNKKSAKWQAQIGWKNAVHYLGMFDDEEDAATAYDVAAQLFFGLFACRNFPSTHVAIHS